MHQAGSGLQMSGAKRLLMLLINYAAFLHLLSVLLVLTWPWTDLKWRCLVGLGLLYFLPPLCARIIKALFPIREGRIQMGSSDFFVWWILFNLQVIFCRLPVLEEALRIIPGFYSVWLRLWGAKVGRLTYWAAGTQILDRSFLRIGDDVVFGAGVRLNPHVMQRNKQGDLELILATVVIGDRATVGGYSLLTAGSEVAPDECTKALLSSPPFSKWENGVRVSKGDQKS